jgi:hypothetical protein
MWEIWALFIGCTLLIGVVAWHFWDRAHGRQVLDLYENPIPWQYDLQFLVLAIIGVMSTAPWLFLDRPRHEAQ